MSQKQNRWTYEKIELLKKLWGQGQTGEHIAKVLGFVSRNAVIGKVHRLGLRRLPKGQNAHNTGDREPVKNQYQADTCAHRFKNNTVVIDAVKNLSDDQCKWPVGDPSTRNFSFCCEKRVEGLPYCEEHHKKAWENSGGRKSEKAIPFQLRRLSLSSH